MTYEKILCIKCGKKNIEEELIDQKQMVKDFYDESQPMEEIRSLQCRKCRELA